MPRLLLQPGLCRIQERAWKIHTEVAKTRHASSELCRQMLHTYEVDA